MCAGAITVQYRHLELGTGILALGWIRVPSSKVQEPPRIERQPKDRRLPVAPRHGRRERFGSVRWLERRRRVTAAETLRRRLPFARFASVRSAEIAFDDLE